MTDNINSLVKNYKGSFYLFDSRTLKERVKYLRELLPENTAICYAVKANTFIIGELINDVDRFEICSPGEAEICRILKVPTEKMVLSGVCKSYDFLDSYISDANFRGILTVESKQQFEQIKTLSKKYGRQVRVLLRVTNGSQFGIDEEDILEMIRSIGSQELISICGIQYFSGTQKTSVKKLCREIEYLDSFIEKIRSECGVSVDELEYGTGFPVSYFTAENLDEVGLISSFSDALKNMRSKVKITLELGRSIAACCGEFYTRVVDLKTNKGQNYALVDGGMHQIVYFGQYMAIKHPYFSVFGKENVPPNEAWNICGSLCSMNDILVKQVPLPPLEVGDVLCFRNTGAYCVTEGISLFLSRDIPAVYLRTEDNEIHCIRETIQTFRMNMSKLKGEINNE